jgi:hypothetical protein
MNPETREKKWLQMMERLWFRQSSSLSDSKLELVTLQIWIRNGYHYTESLSYLFTRNLMHRFVKMQYISSQTISLRSILMHYNKPFFHHLLILYEAFKY